MSWQVAILLQILVGTVVTLYVRRLSLSVKKVYFGMALVSYMSIATLGWAVSLVQLRGEVSLPDAGVWRLLIIEGICIPLAWLVQYRLIRLIGASNAVIVAGLNALATAALGIVILEEVFNGVFIIGSVLIVGGMIVALRIQPDSIHHISAPLMTKFTLALAGALLYAIGMTSEKLAVNEIGAWSYLGFGWSAQALGITTIFLLFGRSEAKYLSADVIRKGIILGSLTVIGGSLFVYAVSLGSLSHTIIATSAKTAIVMLAAAVFLHERNAAGRRVLAFLLTMVGLWLVVQ